MTHERTCRLALAEKCISDVNNSRHTLAQAYRIALLHSAMDYVLYVIVTNALCSSSVPEGNFLISIGATALDES